MSIIVLFFRDFRLEDHAALSYASQQKKEIIPLFIFTSEQATDKNKYKGEASFSYLVNSLKDLSDAIDKDGGTLYSFYGYLIRVLDDIIEKNPDIDELVCHHDYTAYAQEREKKIVHWGKKNNITITLLHDYLLTIPGTVLTQGKKPYSKFTPFYRSALRVIDAQEKTVKSLNWNRNLKKSSSMNAINLSHECTRSGHFFKSIQAYDLCGGRREAKKILKEALAHMKNYSKVRDYPSQKTSFLSAILKFGTLSVREVYREISDYPGFVRQLLWRDFFTHVAYHFPYVFKGSFYKKYDDITWSNSEVLFKKWCEGKTGFPIVDAGMRQLNKTGYMHNRVRLLAASLLVKNLHISWRKGEMYFAQHLTDYDPSVNNGNWQWVAGTGCDTMPYFRVFNPWIQQKKFDPDCTYIYEWIPELKQYTPKEIHKHAIENLKEYYEPCVDAQESAKAFIAKLKKL